MLQELHDKTKTRAEMKIKMFCEKKQKEKEEKLTKLRKEHERGVRNTPQTLRVLNQFTF